MEGTQMIQEQNQDQRTSIMNNSIYIQPEEGGNEGKNSEKGDNQSRIDECGKEEIKLEETVIPKRKRGRPRKIVDISFDSAAQSQAQFSDTKSVKSVKSVKSLKSVASNKPRPPSKLKKSEFVEPKLQHQYSRDNISVSSRKPSRKIKLKQSDPSEKDLCQALLIIKKKLPHRSLERAIIKLYETVQKDKNAKQAEEGNNSVNSQSIAEKMQQEGTISENFEKSIAFAKPFNEKAQTISDCVESQIREVPEEQKFQKLVFPGRRQSCYHDVPADIAAFSHAYYQNPQSLAELESLQKNLGSSALVSKPRAESMINQQFKQEESALTKQTKRDIIYRFNEAEAVKKKFLSPVEEEKHQERRDLANLFIQRGFGYTKAIDDDLPPIQIRRDHYRNLMGGILTATFRKIESFLTGELGLTLRFLDRPQMKAMSLMLINCRIHLQPQNCSTFLKFMRVVYALGDLTVSRSQAINMYVNIMKHLYGKGITIQQLQRKGRISNRRNLESKVEKIKKFVRNEKEKGRRSVKSSRYSTYSGENTLRWIKSEKQSAGNISWTIEMDRELVTLYLQNHQPKIMQKYMQQMYSSLQFHPEEDFQQRVVEVTEIGLKKVIQDSRDPLHPLAEGQTLQDLSRDQVQFISNAYEAVILKHQILKYWLSPTLELLETCIDDIKQTIDNYQPQQVKDLYFQDQNLDFEAADNENNVFGDVDMNFLDEENLNENC